MFLSCVFHNQIIRNNALNENCIWYLVYIIYIYTRLYKNLVCVCIQLAMFFCAMTRKSFKEFSNAFMNVRVQ